MTVEVSKVLWKGRPLTELSHAELVTAAEYMFWRLHDLNGSDAIADRARGRARRFVEEVRHG